MPYLVAQKTGERFRFDGVDRESIGEPANVTEHPVEAIKHVTDHRQEMPLTIDLDVWVTGTPLVDGISTPAQGTGSDRHKYAKDFFDRTKDESLYTYSSLTLGRFEDLSIEDITYDLGEETDNLLSISIDFKQIVYGRTEFVELPPIVVPEQEVEVPQGEQDGEEIEDDDDTNPSTEPNEVLDAEEFGLLNETVHSPAHEGSTMPEAPSAQHAVPLQ